MSQHCNTSIYFDYQYSMFIIIIIFFDKFIYFIYFWLHWVFIAARGLSLVAASGGYSLSPCAGFSLQWLLLLRSSGSRHAGYSSCGLQAQQLWLEGSRAQAQQLWCTGLVALCHVGSSWTRAWTRVPCIGRQILTTAPLGKSLFIISYVSKENTNSLKVQSNKCPP